FVGNRTYQNPLEPHCAIAEWNRPDKVTLYTSTQVVHYVHYQLARILGVPLGAIRVVMHNCGGGFGAKAATNPLEIVSILLAREAGCPVKMRFNREEMYLYGRGRHEQTIDLEIGVKKDGTITAVKQKAVLEGGAYSSFGVVTTYYAGSMLPTLYKIPNYKYDGYRVNTNLPPCGAMRGHGCPHPRFAFESLLTMIADDLGLDPIDIRVKNAMEPETRTCNDLDIHSCELKACLRVVRERSGWEEKRGKLPPGRGIGVGCGGFVSGAGYPIYRSEFPHSNAIIKVEDDGSKAVLFTGEADIGQGSDTVLGQIAAEAMGISFDRVEVVSADSDITPLGLGAYSSRVTLMGGNAARMAGEEVKLQVVSAAAKMLDMPASELEAKDNRILARGQPDKSIGWREAAAAHFSEAGPLLGKGHYSPPKGLGGKYKGAAVGTSPAFSFSAAVCEVEVDMETGKIRVLNFWDAHDCGTAINPMAVEGQVEGAVVMGLSETLLEQEEFDERGRMRNPDLHNYLLATSMDVPIIDSSIVESFEPAGPFGAKEVGEGATLPVLGAIANAVADAIGVRIFDLPITPEKVLQAIKRGRSTS
ncbi:MAG: molybdopterin cofactor-binding domain-containing protein, partial [Thermoanaerobaculia bacterium]